MYIINIKNLYIKFKKFFFSLALSSILVSCSLLENESVNNIKSSQNSLKKIKCPQAKIPYETAKYISNKKFLLKINKVEMICKNSVDDMSGQLEVIIEYKAKLEFKFNKKINQNNLNLPHVYIAIVDTKKENILVKMFSDKIGRASCRERV